MQAIQTRYLGPTATKGTRIRASSYGGSVTISYQHNLTLTENHLAAAQALQLRLQWTGTLASGTLPNGDVAHVFTVG